MPQFKCGQIAILGRPNAGKSTLLNALTELNFSATSKRPQTTRTNIKGIINRSNKKKEWVAQMVFVDTPGVNFKKGLLDRSMHMSVEGALRNVDLAVWVADARTFERDLRDVERNRPGSDKLAAWLKDKVSITSENTQWILALSKCDIVPKGEILELIDRCSKVMPQFKAIVPIAAELGLKNDNSNLTGFLQYIEEHLPEGKAAFEKDRWTDLNERQLVQNLIREQIFRMGREEVPYETDCTILQFIEPTGHKKMAEVDATIWVAKDSLKPIIVGAGGSKIKDIGMKVRQRYQDITGEALVLRLFVKVVEKWESRAQNLTELGYVL